MGDELGPRPRLCIVPPLLNSANPWASTQADLKALYECEATGAVTTRTCLVDTGFPHDDSVNQYTFFDPSTHASHRAANNAIDVSADAKASLNTLGYSPYPLQEYISWIEDIVANSVDPTEGKTALTVSQGQSLRRGKAFIVSVTGSPVAVAQCHAYLSALAERIPSPVAMEINLSCPNIPNKPPPAYSATSLAQYLAALPPGGKVAVGIKTPPYTYQDQFDALFEGIAQAASTVGSLPISFITATNTLGGCLVLRDSQPALASASGEGIGGMAGAPLHPLALGNVKTLRRMLDTRGWNGVDVIGVGGVEDAAGYDRMREAGASAVGVGTGLGRKGVKVFADILGQVGLDKA